MTTENASQQRPPWILPAIITSQFAGTSLWFAGNAVMSDLQVLWKLDGAALGWMTSSVQLGFIAGTLISTALVLADRFSPQRIFVACALAGAALNVGPIVWEGLWPLLAFRFLTGVCLAGIYPVGMKIAASWFHEGLGRALGFLVGALVLGTATPHLIKSLGQRLPWSTVLVVVSIIAALGGVLILLFVPDGPNTVRRKARDRQPLQLGAVRAIFSAPSFRAAAVGYFGHMWELYAFWTFVPAALIWHSQHHGSTLNVSTWAFVVIAVGSIGCVAGGILSRRYGSAPVAAWQLATSGLCSLLAPFTFMAPWPVFIVVMVVWGITVVGDSAQFSTLNAQTAPPELVGSGLTIVTSIGFSITIVSIQLLSALSTHVPLPFLFPILAAGPVVGLLSLRPLLGATSVLKTR